MSTSTKQLFGALALSLAAVSASLAQESTSAATPQVNVPAAPATTTTTVTALAPASSLAPIAARPAPSSELAPMTLVQAAPAPARPIAGASTTATSTDTTTATTTTTTVPSSVTENGGVGVREFQGDDVGQVLRLLARQSKINMVVSEAATGTVTMRLEDVTALQAIAIIVKAKGLFMDQIDNVYYIKTGAERTAEPTESDSYQFSYGRAKDIAPLIALQLASKDAPQVDERTNTIFFRETRSNIDNVRKTLAQIDKPTKQVMIEARLVEVNANPKQSYGINWAGVVGSSSAPQTLKYGGLSGTGASAAANTGGTTIPTTDFGHPVGSAFGDLLAGQFAILSVPQMSLTVRALNEDSDAEFLANPRIVTADNQQAKIEIIRNQPVPQLNFNEQTATAVFGGFQDKKFGNTLVVRPSVNKDDFITLSVKPEISNKVADAEFVFAGATVRSPIIDTRTLDSNVLIKSGDTLAIGGLLQDEVTKSRNKVPIMGDIPVLGYFFQERLNARTKRNLLVFVTPTILEQRYGTGLEDQVSGLHHSGEEFADPNGWRNNARGAVRLVPTSNRQIATDYPAPGIAPPPAKLRFMSTAKDRDF
ncbi:MAG: secretin N-terminal domain-containing protein [Spartobacteria bacterium]